jgi:putative membrane-bound dehydrogenase-like protein
MNRKDGPHEGNPAVREEVKNKVPQHTAWAVQRDDGGRGFGFTGGHFHNGWGNDNQRKLVLNGIIWTAHGEVPAEGVKSKVTEEDLKKNLDPKPGQGLPEKPKGAAKPNAPAKPEGTPKPAASAAGAAVKPLFQSEVSKTSGLVNVSVDLKGAKQLFLVVSAGPDGISADWTDWVEPTLVIEGGKSQKLSALPMKKATSGWGAVLVNKNAAGGEMRLEGMPADQRLLGIGTHSNSVIAFDLPEHTLRLEAKVCLDEGGTRQNSHNKVIAQVYTSEPPAALIAGGKSVEEKPYGFAAANEQMKDFTTPKGLSATLFAAEPRVQNPTNIDIDPKGRVWVLEAVNYRSSLKPWGVLRDAGDRVAILEDSKGTGVADKEITFYQSRELTNPLGLCVLPMANGKGTQVIVSAAPYVWLLTDADGDDKAERAQKLFKTEGSFDHDHNIHAFSFGQDGKFYFNFGNAATALLHVDGTPVIDIHGNAVKNNDGHYRQGMIFRCDIDLAKGAAKNVETLAYNFRNNYEVCVDSFGGMWQSDNDDDGNKGVRINAIVDYGSYGYTDDVTGAGWKTPRTNMEKEIPLQHWHQNDPGTIPNLLQTGSGSPTGMCVNEGATLGKVFENQMIHCDAGPRTVRAYPVTKMGAGYKAEMVDILTSTDTWYRPSDCCIAPDGSLFVADWYDPGVGGHNMGDHEKGKVRGRIYRVAPQGLAYKPGAFDFSNAEGCATALLSPNNSTRFVAWQKLNAMGAKGADALKNVASSANPRYRARALHLQLRQPGAFQSVIEKALADDSADIRVTAVRELRLAAAYHKLPDAISQDLAAWLLPHLAAEQDKQVLREYALTLRDTEDPAKIPSSAEAPKGKKKKKKANAPIGKPADDFAQAWVTLAKKHDGNDRWYLEALGIGAMGRETRALQAWLDSVNGEWNTPAGRDIVWRVRSPVAFKYLTQLLEDKKADEESTARYLRAFDFLPDGEPKSKALVQVLATNAGTDHVALTTDVLKRIAKTDQRDKEQVRKTLAAVLAKTKGKPEFLQLVEAYNLLDKYAEVLDGALANVKDPGAQPALKFLLAHEESRKLVGAALGTPKAEKVVSLLGGSTDKQSVSMLTNVVTNANRPAPLRIAAVKALSLTAGGATALVGLAESHKIPEDTKSAARTALAMVQYPGLSERVAKAFPAPQSAGGKSLPPIPQLAKLKGDPTKGKELFARAESSCTLCHRVSSIGVDFAPALTEIGSKLGKDALYEAILSPNAGISMGFETTELKMKNGSSALGIIRSETTDQVILALPGGVTNSFAKSDISTRTKLPISMMPTGLQMMFTQDQLVDLVEYLSSLKAATSAKPSTPVASQSPPAHVETVKK